MKEFENFRQTLTSFHNDMRNEVMKNMRRMKTGGFSEEVESVYKSLMDLAIYLQNFVGTLQKQAQTLDRLSGQVQTMSNQLGVTTPWQSAKPTPQIPRPQIGGQRR